MKLTGKYFDVFPLVVPAGEETRVCIRPLFAHAAFPPAEEMKIAVIPCLGALPDGRHVDYSWKPTEDEFELIAWRINEGVLEITARFHEEQRHVIQIMKADGAPLWEFYVYSLQPDLYRLRPFKGDFHMHTTASDGKESPEYVAARCREAGFDFIAITDHHKYEPSIQAMQYWNQYGTGLTLFPGEEVHPPDCPVHMVNFGGSFSLDEIFRRSEAQFRREVTARIPGLGEVTPGVNPFAVAATEWVFDKIREGGGLAVYCHPYWEVQGRNVISGALADEIFRRRKFDALEMIGGFRLHQTDCNLYQIVRTYGEWAGQGDFPVVGLSDSHGTDHNALFGWYYTLVFAESYTLENLTAAIRNGYSVAVEAPAEERVHCHGSSRLVRYAQFLLREYFPRHAAICRPEGEIMRAILAGEQNLASTLTVLGGRAAAFRRQAFTGAPE